MKLVASVICALFLIDTIGRKRSIIAGIALQVIAFFYVAIFLNIVPIDRQENYQTSSSEQSASTGAIAMIYVSGAGWALGKSEMQRVIRHTY